ncbi:hypothetical protein [Actinokineospora sp.]|uniref:hypothetical protein n=1 Tax=Actinokineospora sp. TaxID=1872133 RepID=UPI003D6C0496
MHTPLLLCADPLRPTKADPHFAAEAHAARSLSAVTALIDHDRLLAGEYRRAHELPGWYSVFADRTPASVWADGVPDVRPLRPGSGSSRTT